MMTTSKSYFGRKCTLLAGMFKEGETEATAADLSGLDFDFDVDRSIIWYENMAKFTLYNPGHELVNKILYDSTAIKFMAGYDEDSAESSPKTYGTIFLGNIYKAWPEWSGDNLLLRMVCKSSRGPNYQLTKVPIVLSFRKGTPIFDVVKTLADYAAIPLVGAESLKAKKLGSDFSFSGSVAGAVLYLNSEVIRTQISRRAEIYLDNSQMIFVNERDGIFVNFVSLGFDSGLLSLTPYRDESDEEFADMVKDNLEYYFTGDSKYWKATKETVKDERKKIRFTALVNAGIMPGSKVHINTSGGRHVIEEIDNDFFIRSAKFSGDNYGGKFTVTCEAVESPSTY